MEKCGRRVRWIGRIHEAVLSMTWPDDRGDCGVDLTGIDISRLQEP